MNSILGKLRLQAMNSDSLKISKASLGRVTAMLQESLEMYKKSPANAFAEFVKRVQSIKSSSVREEVEKNLLKKIANRKEKEEDGKTIVTWQQKALPGFDKSMEQLQLLALLGWDANRCKQEVDKKWGDFLLLTLVHQKYIKSKEEVDSNDE